VRRSRKSGPRGNDGRLQGRTRTRPTTAAGRTERSTGRVFSAPSDLPPIQIEIGIGIGIEITGFSDSGLWTWDFWTSDSGLWSRDSNTWRTFGSETRDPMPTPDIDDTWRTFGSETRSRDPISMIRGEPSVPFGFQIRKCDYDYDHAHAHERNEVSPRCLQSKSGSKSGSGSQSNVVLFGLGTPIRGEPSVPRPDPETRFR